MYINNKHLLNSACVFVMLYSLSVAVIKYSAKKPKQTNQKTKKTQNQNNLEEGRVILGYGSQVHHGGEDTTTGRGGMVEGTSPSKTTRGGEREEPAQSPAPVMYKTVSRLNLLKVP